LNIFWPRCCWTFDVDIYWSRCCWIFDCDIYWSRYCSWLSNMDISVSTSTNVSLEKWLHTTLYAKSTFTL